MSTREESINKALEAARQILDDIKNEDVRLRHSHNYLKRNFKKTANSEQKKAPPKLKSKLVNPNLHASLEEEIAYKQRTKEEEVVYTKPGSARALEIIPAPLDTRAGAYPQHNSAGDCPKNLEVIRALGFEEYRKYFADDSMMKHGFERRNHALTQKRLYEISEQFAHLSFGAFKQMMGVMDTPRRDFEIWVKEIKLPKEFSETRVGLLNLKYNMIQFMQVITRNPAGEVINLKNITYDAGEPVVINESLIDKFGNKRGIAHIGAKGPNATIMNALERFDDGTICWHVSQGLDIPKTRLIANNMLKYDFCPESATALMKEDGSVFFVDPITGQLVLRDNLTQLAQTAARNLGAEGIDASTQDWTGDFALEACIAEAEDRYILRREYKEAVRKQLYQIIDGASIPGLDPIFNV